MSAFLRTVDGDVAPSLIKGVLPHEHGFLARNKETPAQLKALGKKIARRLAGEFRALVDRGINLFVECTMNSVERQPELWSEAGKKTGMHVIATTGFYVTWALPERVKKMSVDELAALMHREVTDEMERSSRRAGLIKVSSNAYGVEEDERKVFLAAAAVHRETNVPITTHSPKGALPHVKLLEEHGVAPERVSLGHFEVDPWPDIKELARKGAMLIFTNWGCEDIIPEDLIIAQIVDLAKKGYLKQIMISVDMFIYMDKSRLSYRWPGGFKQIPDRVVPKLIRHGLKAREIDVILHENPLRHLAWG